MPKLATEEAIERLRTVINPEGYKAQIEMMRTELLTRAAILLANRDLNEASPHLLEAERAQANEQIDRTLVDIEWRVAQIDERIKEFQESREAVKRPMNRRERRAVAKETPTDA